MDVSDGLAWDLFRLARAAGVGVELELAAVPIHRDARRMAGRALWHALHDGEDHELVACITPARWKRCSARARRLFPALCVVGHVLAGHGLCLRDAHGATRRWKRSEGGWSHGTR
jgi:thiamine-monophosphate kinase